MVIYRLCHRILRVSLPMAVIVNYQVAGQPHQLIRKVALSGVILVQSAVNTYKNLLRKVFRPFSIRRKPVSKVEDTPRERGHYLFPGNAIP